ncbi:PQQ-binding-like beta-propeller repeat protein, partial [Acinetobacter baumannii]
VSTALVLSGCSIFSSKKQANPPAALVNLTPTLSTKVLWSVSVGQSGAYAFSPVSMDGAVYAASADGYVTRIDLATGKQAWHSQANKSGL